MISGCSGTVILNSPFMSVAVPRVVPFNNTVTPGITAPFRSLTCPFIVTDFFSACISGSASEIKIY